MRMLTRCVALVTVALILTTASIAHAVTFPGPTLGSGDIAINNPVSGEITTTHCSFTGAMTQARTGQLDRGCWTDGQYYGGGPGGWTEIDILNGQDINLSATNPTFVIQSTQIYIESPLRKTTISGDTNLLFQVVSSGLLDLGQFIKITSSNAPGVFLVDTQGGPPTLAQLNLDSVEISGNAGSGAQGAPCIQNNGGTVNVSGSLLASNGSNGSKGGGLYNLQGVVTVSNTTIVNNSALEYGGGIMNDSGTMTLSFVTVGGNTQYGNGATGEGGGGIYQVGSTSTMNIEWSTIYGNRVAHFAGARKPLGGGILIAGGTVNLKNSILAGNFADDNDDCYGGTITSGGRNLFGNMGHCVVTSPPAGRPDVSPLSAGLNPLSSSWMTPLEFYSPTTSSAAYNGIPATDADCEAIFGGSSACDIGAFQPGD